MKIIALLEPKGDKPPNTISDKDFIQQAKDNNNVYTLEEFQNLWNNDEVKVKDYFIRFFDVKLSSIV